MRGLSLEFLFLFVALASPVIGKWYDACRSNEGAKGNLNRIILRVNNAIKRHNIGKMHALSHRIFKNPVNLRSQICLIRSHTHMAEINLGGEIAYAKKCGLEKSEKLLWTLQAEFDHFLEVAKEPEVDEATDETPELTSQLAIMTQLLPPMYRRLEGIVLRLADMRKNMESRHSQDFCVYHRLLQNAAKNCYKTAVQIYTAAVRSETRFIVTVNQKANIGAYLREAEDWRSRMNKNKVTVIREIRQKIADARAQINLLSKANYLEALVNIRDNCEDLQVKIEDLDQIQYCPKDMHLHWYR